MHGEREDGHGGRDVPQRELARSLVSLLGLGGAIRTCRMNCWDGVLTELLGAGEFAV